MQQCNVATLPIPLALASAEMIENDPKETQNKPAVAGNLR